MSHRPHFESKTEKGFKFFFLGIILYIIWQISFVLLIFSMQDALTEFASRQTDNDPQAIESIAGYLAPLCGTIILLLLIIVLLLIGLVFIFTGRAEFGEKQARNTEIGLVLLIVSFMVGLIASIFIGFGQPEGNIMISINFVITIFTAICYSLGFFFLLKNILDPFGVKFLKFGVTLYIIITFINISLVSTIIFTDFDLSGLTENYFLIGMMFSALITIPWAIYAFSFFRAWKILKWEGVKPTIPIAPTFTIPPPDSMSPFGTQRPGADLSGKPAACPSCGFIIEHGQVECPKCGYYFNEK
jgi:hypothetical protein